MTMNSLAVVARDAAAFSGAGLIAFGAWLIFPPAGFIVGGLLILAGAIAAARGGS